MITRLLYPMLALPLALVAQTPAPSSPKVPPPDGFRVYMITDMEGMASVVFNREIISGYEGERYRTQSSPDYWNHYRGLFTQAVNAAIAGARITWKQRSQKSRRRLCHLTGTIREWASPS